MTERSIYSFINVSNHLVFSLSNLILFSIVFVCLLCWIGQEVKPLNGPIRVLLSLHPYKLVINWDHSFCLLKVGISVSEESDFTYVVVLCIVEVGIAEWLPLVVFLLVCDNDILYLSC